MLSSFGGDGLGRRVEAAFTCIGVAGSQGLAYAHAPFTHLEHGISPARAEEFIGLGRAYPTLPVVYTGRLRTPIVSDARFRLVERNQTNGYSCAPDKWLASDEAACAGGGRCTCTRDNATVYIGSDCWSRFWCGGQSIAAHAAWYRALLAIRAAYYSNMTHKALPADWDAGRHCTVVGVHMRSVKRRALPMSLYQAVIGALIRRHAAHLEGGVKHGRLQIRLHTDRATPAVPVRSPAARTATAHQNATRPTRTGSVQSTPEEDFASWLREQPSSHPGVSVVTIGGEHDALHSFHELVSADIVVTARSSFSVAAAMLGNATVLRLHPRGSAVRCPTIRDGGRVVRAPTGLSEAPLPHWITWPCPSSPPSGATPTDATLADEMVAAIPHWPPRNPRRIG